MRGFEPHTFYLYVKSAIIQIIFIISINRQMEYLENEIKTIVFTPETITITYDNNEVEIVKKTKEGYMKLYDAWLKEQPMFISDIFKSQMRDLTFIKRDESFNDMNKFLSEENKEQALKFIVYMRKRDLTYERSKWIKVNADLNSSNITDI